MQKLSFKHMLKPGYLFAQSSGSGAHTIFLGDRIDSGCLSKLGVDSCASGDTRLGSYC